MRVRVVTRNSVYRVTLTTQSDFRMASSRPGAYSIPSHAIALLFARKAVKPAAK